jgi:ATP-dependent Clp protease ATP-binding subunit ClpA
MVITVGLSKVSEILFTVLADDELAKELMGLKSSEEIFEFFQSLDDEGYTKEEFNIFYNQLMTIYDKEIASGKSKNIFEALGIDNSGNNNMESDIENVSGGSFKNWKAKLASGALAALTAITPIYSSSVRAEAGGVQQSPVVEAASEEQKPNQERSWLASKFINIKDRAKKFWEKNKEDIKFYGRAAGGVAITLASLFLIWKAFSILQEKSAKKKALTTLGMYLDKDNNLDPSLSIDEMKNNIREEITKLNKDPAANKERIKTFTGAYNELNKGDAADFIIGNFNKFFLPITTAGGLAMAMLRKVADISKTASQISGFKYSLQNIKHMIEDTVRVVSPPEEASVPAKDMIAKVEKALQRVRGQEEAKKEILRNLSKFFIGCELAEMTGQVAPTAMLYLSGPPGVGKTWAAKSISEIIGGKQLELFAGSFNKESSRSVIDQMFGSKVSANYYGNREEESAQIINHFARGGKVAIVNEIEKVWSSQVEETCREIVDAGSVTIEGKTTPLPGKIIIFTSNEVVKQRFSTKEEAVNHAVEEADEDFRVCFEGEITPEEMPDVKAQFKDQFGVEFNAASLKKVKADYLNKIAEETARQYDEKSKTIKKASASGVRTPVFHTESFLNRVNIIEFNELEAKNLESIIKSKFRNNVINYWKEEEIAGINVKIDNTVIKKMAEWAENQKQGARPVENFLIPTLNSDIIEKLSSEKIESFKKSVFNVDFNEKTEKFSLKIEKAKQN